MLFNINIFCIIVVYIGISLNFKESFQTYLLYVILFSMLHQLVFH